MSIFSDLLLCSNAKTIEAIAIINNSSSRAYIALIIDESNKLVGTVTDGDIRRGLLSGKSLESNVKEFMNSNFTSIYYHELSDSKIREEFKKSGVNIIPILDKSGAVIDIAIQNKPLSIVNPTKNNPVVIMAGGKGSRLGSYTKDCPKPMLPIGGKPILHIILENCINYGLKDFYISVNYLKNQIIDYFGDGSEWGVSIQYLHELKPLGTAGSLQLLPESIQESILVINGDILTHLDFDNLFKFHYKNNAQITVCTRQERKDIPYGVINLKGIYIENIIEKPTYSFLVNAGIYLVKPSLLKEYIKENTFLDMPSLIIRVKEKYKNIFAFPIHEYWIDIGKPESLHKAHKEWISPKPKKN